MALFPSSYIPTVAATVTRQPDVLNLATSFAPRPAAMSIYVRFLELGTILQQGTIVQVANPTITQVAPYFIVNATAAPVYQAYFTPGGIIFSSSVAGVAPVIGNMVELLATLSATGSTQLTQAINGGAPVTAAAGGATTLPQTFGGAGLCVGPGFLALRNLVIMRGVQPFITMQRYAGVQ